MQVQGLPAVGIVKAYLEAVALVAEELGEELPTSQGEVATLPSSFVGAAHAQLEAEACSQLVELTKSSLTAN